MLVRKRLPLTSKELHTLELMCDGMTNREIASRLVLSEDSIKSRVRRVLFKLNADNRTQAVAMAIRSGLVK